MFKLESYVTPWLLSYLDKYVKLKPEDFQLSLWGGDAIFNKLDLRLNVIENLTHVPVTFKSGVIHELRIHIPWTRITSEPVVVTINTLEFVAKLKDSDKDISLSSSATNLSTSSTQNLNQSQTNENVSSNHHQQHQPQQQLPSGYIQNILSKILSNMCIIVNNVIVKFVEDDIVLSFNMKSAEFYSVNSQWEKSFIDMANDLHLRKILKLNDVTICLDKLDNKKNSRINFYQDPLIYRCSIQSRIDFIYSPITNNQTQQPDLFNHHLKQIRLNFYCRKLGVSITDQQLPMLLRLIELILAILDGTLIKMSSSEESTESQQQAQIQPIQEPTIIDLDNQTEDSNQVKQDETNNQGWISWAWSYVPSVTTILTDEDDIQSNQQTSQNQEPLKKEFHLQIGFYFDEINISFKLIQQQTQLNETTQQKIKSLNANSFIQITLKGIAIEINNKLNENSHVLLGISYINMKSLGECCCKLCLKPNENEVKFLTSGQEDLEEKTFHYLSYSLFDDDYTLVDDNQFKSRDNNGCLDEAYGIKRFGAIYLDIYQLENQQDESKTNVYSFYLLVYRIELNLSANFMHRIFKVYESTQTHSYTQPYSLQQLPDKSVSTNSVDSLTNSYNESIEKLANKLEKYIPLMTHTIILKEPLVRFHPYSHFYTNNSFDYRCYFQLEANCVSINIREAFDKEKLFELVSNLINPTKKLLYDSYIHTNLILDGVNLKWNILIDSLNNKLVIPVIEPCFVELNLAQVIMQADMWKNEYFPLKKIYFELPNLKVNIHKQMLFILTDYYDNYVASLDRVISQMKQPNLNKQEIKKTKLRQMVYKRLLEDFFLQSKNKRTEILKLCLSDLKFKYSLTKTMQIIQMSLHSLQVYLFKHEQPDNLLTICETLNSKNSELIELKSQLPLIQFNNSSYIPDPLFLFAKLNRIDFYLRNELFDWLNYKPTRSDDELLNSLILELFDDYNTFDTLNKHTKQDMSSNSSIFKIKSSISSLSLPQVNTTTTPKMTKTKTDNKNNSNESGLIDQYYDLMKSFHVSVLIEPISINLNSELQLNLPRIEIKSIGTKCDIEEELKLLSELPCTYLRACEKTSNKLPWLIDVKNLDLHHKSKKLISIDLNSFFTLKPKFQNHNNLLQSLGVILNVDTTKKSIDLDLTLEDLKSLILLMGRVSECFSDFKFKFDYSEFEAKINYEVIQTSNDVDDRKSSISNSTLSISKEYDLVMVEEDEDDDENDNDEDYDMETSETNFDDEHCSLSSDTNYSTYSSSSSLYHHRKKKSQKTNKKIIKKEDSPVLLIMEREKNTEQIKLNFVFNLLVSNLNLNLYNSTSSLLFQFNKISCQIDMNNIYQKVEFKLKKFQINSDEFKLVETLEEQANLVELTFTRALISNLNKKLGGGGGGGSNTPSNSNPMSSFIRVIASGEKTKIGQKLVKSTQKWITEINLTLQSIDLNVNLEKLIILFQFNNLTNDLFEKNFPNKKISFEDTTNTNQLIPLIRASDVPLMNIELNTIRIKFNDDLLLRLSKLMLTSQIENPLIRNFTNISSNSSISIYNKAKSNGYIYMPGFPFEDRQYWLKLTGLSLETAHHQEPILNSLDLNLLIALPICLDNKLINGYSLEINLINPSINLNNKSLNLILNLIDSNLKIINENITPIKSDNKLQKQVQMITKEILPVDLLITLDNVNIYLNHLNENQMKPLMWLQFIQPHVTLHLHEQIQLFEFQIFDFNIKRATPSTFNTSLIPNKNDYLLPVLDTRQGDLDKKTGIMSAFLTIKLTDFAQLLLFENNQIQTNQSVICVCNSCLKCYEFNHLDDQLTNLNINILIERPVRLTFNLIFLEQLNELISKIDLKTNQTISSNQESKSDSFDFVKHLMLFDLNACFKSKQIVFIFDLPSQTNSSLYFSFNNLLIQYSKKVSMINCLDVIVNDFQSKYQLRSFMNEYIRFMGPTTLKLNSSFNPVNNELFIVATIGSLCFTINKQFIQFMSNLIQINQTKESTIQKEICLVNKNETKIKHYEDDLRNSNFKYKIVDMNYMKTKSHLNPIEHLRLPDMNEIICVDDLNLDGLYASTVTWRYANRRALTSLIINPLPFIGQQDSNQLECYLEYFNECLKKFNILKIFYLNEGVYINVLNKENNDKLVYSKLWRIRFSNETRKLVYASSLLASTRVDSIEENLALFYTHFEGSITNLELKLNKFISNNECIDTADLSILNLNDLGLRLIQNNELDLILYGQLGIEFCEYRFLTMQPLIDSFQFKLITNQSGNNLDLNLQIDNLNLLISESSLISLKQIENELTNNTITSLEYYMIYNDTNVGLNVKQYDTEESCLIKSGECLPYSWRSHKKKQLLQIFISKYKQNSSPFEINQIGVKEIQIKLSNNTNTLFLIKITDEQIKKIIHIETKLVVCNYLDLSISSICLTYSNLNMIQIGSVDKLSRSRTTYELIESFDSKLNSIEINNKKILANDQLDLEEQLKLGLICHDAEFNSKYWITLTQFSSQLCLILSPVFVFCSYLPYDLKIQFDGSQTSLIKSNTVSHMFPQKSLTDKELAIKFDHLSLNNNKSSSSHGNGLLNDWFDQNVVYLNEKDIKPFDHVNESFKRLKYTNLFKYKLLNSDEVDTKLDEDYNINFTILTHQHQHQVNQEQQQQTQVIDHLKEQFIIEKSKCWSFTKTLRIDIKPICLLLNKTNYKINLIEKQDDSLSEIYYDLDSPNGQICLSNSLNKKYKLQIECDEYMIKNYDLIKNTSQYESDWFKVSDEISSPFYREHTQLNNPVLYSNKCWIDLKLFPINNTSTNSNKLKLIYLLLQNDINHVCRMITIQNKFLFVNKTKSSFKFDLTADYSVLNKVVSTKPVYISTNEIEFKPNEFYSTSDLLNTSHSETDEFYLNINEMDSHQVVQSKLVVLTTKEKAIKQISTSTSSNENLLISRQCFCLYNLKHNTTRAFICAQKLLIGKNDGRLLVTLKEDLNSLIQLTNRLPYDLLIWPRISSNYILENYMKHISSTNRSLVFMHKIPTNFKFYYNYDFIGTNHYPIENLNEQIFFMFALLDNKDDFFSFHLSPNMCRLFESNFEIRFEHNSTLCFKYTKTSQPLTREITLLDYVDKPVKASTNETKMNLKLNFNIDRLTLAINNDFSSNIYQTEILRLTIDYLGLKLNLNDSISVELSSQHLQLDNQMFDLTSTDNQKYDFPVIFIPRSNSSSKKLRSQLIYKTFDSNLHLLNTQSNDHEFIHLKLQLENHFKSKMILTEFELNIKPFDIYLEDYLVYNLIKITMDYISLLTWNDLSSTSICDSTNSNSREEDLNQSRDLSILFDPILMIKKLKISRIDALVSLQTSLKIYCATYKTPVIFDDLIVTGMPWSIQSSPQMVKLFTSHYLTSLLFRLGWVVGSLDLIGSPTAFIHTVSNGVYDFLRLPYRGLRDTGPTGFIQGFSNGTLSLIKNLSAGTITSITSFSSFVSRNMDILSFDPDHLARQEQLRHQLVNDQFGGNSLVQISSGFIISIMGALGGLAQQPIQSVQDSDSFIKGVSKGIIGLVTKPVGAVAELVNQTGQGILRITGVNRIPPSELRLQKKALNKEFSRYSISMVKCLWKLIIQNSTNKTSKIRSINAMIEVVYQSQLTNEALTRNRLLTYNANQLTACYLILNEHTLFVVDKNDDMLLRAFYITQIEMSFKSSDKSSILIVELQSNPKTISVTNETNSDKNPANLNEYEIMYQNTLDRLVDFIQQQNALVKNSKPNSSLFISNDYYKFEKLDYLNFFKYCNGLPCICGAQLTSLAPNLSNKLSLNESDTKSNELIRNQSVSRTNSIDQTQLQSQPKDMPKIHRIKSSESMEMSKLKNLSDTDTILKQQQQKFVYYIDPRLADNFISIFQSLKKKLLNKGFQF